MCQLEHERGGTADIQKSGTPNSGGGRNLLGYALNSMANITAEVDRQIQQVNIALWKLDSYRKASEASKRRQLLIFETAHEEDRCLSDERAQENPKQETRAYWGREASNENILYQVNWIINGKEHPRKARLLTANSGRGKKLLTRLEDKNGKVDIPDPLNLA